MVWLVPRLRGLAQRGGATVMILAVALVAAAAAATGPIYYQATRTSILRDGLVTTPVTGRGYEANETGAVPGLLGQLAPVQQGQLDTSLGNLAGRGLFAPPLYSVETTVPFPQELTSVPLVWRSDVCAHLRIDGACPAARGQVIVSRATAAVTGWHIGQQLRFPGYSALTITGLYALPDQTLDYWFGHGSTYFPVTTTSFSPSSSIDAMFATRSTLEHSPATQQGAAVVDDVLNSGRITGDEVAPLNTAMTAFNDSPGLWNQQIIVSTAIPATLQTVHSSWSSVAVPVVLITAQLLVLCLLLLFLAVTDAVEARGPEIALAKLRGRGAWSTVAFGLSEPVMLLALALPAGTLAGWGATAVICQGLLRPGTPVVLPGLAWATAAAATAGGLAAAVLAARRTLRRPVLDEWRRSGSQAANRGWVVDAVLATGAAAGLLDLAVTGQISSARPGTLILLVPGLLGLAVAVIASRLLPLGCRAAFARTGRGGGLGLFLALRHVARRPGGVRTTIVLATAFALAAFAVSAWSVGRGNQRRVAAIEVGAPTVFTVSTPAGKDLSTIVARADPGGRMAAAVDSYTSLSGGTAGSTTLGVDPARFARIAAWQPGPNGQPLAALAPRLEPRAPQPVILTGDSVRLTVQVHALSPPGTLLAADVTTGSSPVSLGPLPAHGTATLTGQLVGCPCVLRDLDLSPPSGYLQNPVRGSVTITGFQVHGHSGWAVAGPAGVLADAGHWRPGRSDDPPDKIQPAPGALTWQFTGRPRQDAILTSVNRPDPLPAVVAAALVSPGQALAEGVGLNRSPLELRVIGAAAAVPGAPSNGVIVDRRYAELAAGQDLSFASEQVWLADDAQPIIEPRLKAAGVQILSSRSAASVAATFARQGPALASVLFLADAAAAALLAAGAAVLGLYLSARRRRYEYAALSASGVPHLALRRSVLTELGLVLGFGSVIGAGTGLLAAVLALRSVPEFLSPPPVPALSYVPSAAALAVLLGAAAGLLIIAAVTAGIMLIRGVSLDQLRETPP
jgi:putative ABC transport system permease protein